jgi:hypothetical protein
MEIQRDSQKDRGITPIPYSPDLFHNDRDFYLAYRKIEHIVAAVFLVTGLIEGDVLMRNAIREHSLKSLNQIVSLIGKPGVGVSDVQQVAAHVLHLSSLLDIAFWSGQISQMNLSIMQREIGATYQTLNDLSVKYKNNYYISSSFFKTDEEILKDVHEKETTETSGAPVLYKGQSKRQDKRQTIKDITKTESPLNTTSVNGEHKVERREAILALLRERSNLSVKDFVAVVPEYSEKTIQRELLALVEEGVITKQGERRWSTYSMAS